MGLGLVPSRGFPSFCGFTLGDFRELNDRDDDAVKCLDDKLLSGFGNGKL